jgi:hypothetical protein
MERYFFFVLAQHGAFLAGFFFATGFFTAFFFATAMGRSFLPWDKGLKLGYS